MNKHLKQFLISTVFFGIVNGSLAIKANAQDRVGTGGSGSDVAIVNEVFKLEDVATKVLRFFARTPELRGDFPEVNIMALILLRNSIDYEVTNDELRDDQGAIRSCLNYNTHPRKKIICNLQDLRALNVKPEEYFTLVAHELFGLVGVEETSLDHENLIQSYPVSGRLARFVSRVSSYDLVFRDAQSSTGCNVLMVDRGRNWSSRHVTIETNRLLENALMESLRAKGYHLVTHDGESVDYYFNYASDRDVPTQEGNIITKAFVIVKNFMNENVYFIERERVFRRRILVNRRNRALNQFIEEIAANIPNCDLLKTMAPLETR